MENKPQRIRRTNYIHNGKNVDFLGHLLPWKGFSHHTGMVPLSCRLPQPLEKQGTTHQHQGLQNQPRSLKPTSARIWIRSHPLVSRDQLKGGIKHRAIAKHHKIPYFSLSINIIIIWNQKTKQKKLPKMYKNSSPCQWKEELSIKYITKAQKKSHLPNYT